MTTQRRPHAIQEVIWISHKGDEKCGKCGAEIFKGNYVQMNEKDGVRCADCAGYGDMSFMPAGDAGLTRLATSLSSRVVVVVRWSSARERSERQGILVDDAAWEAVASKVEADAAANSGKKGYRPAFKVIEMDGERILWKQ